ncbi:SRP72 domain-containing protein [Mycena indigotica]|uniref:Signal recognition particle subunit SRP72 n=1 Tax=Mycena indigotica TaxID=2126181 RepID=A0A8H6S668_9AGAR|nr:SRP72 domain-containing protein [Mycena indigotica]KAF7292030.1 SRP72 domain-containing protein [Mycena indigotica]
MPAKTKPKATPAAKHVSKPKTRPAPTVPAQLTRLFKTLCAQIDGGHHASAIKTCDKILRLAPGDEDALQTKLFLLLTTDQPREALALIEGLPAESAFEKAYALYSLQQRDEARMLLDGIGEEERGARHLAAQLNYREGAYQATLDIYNDLLDSAPTAEEHADIATNTQAASTHLDFINAGYLRGLSALSGAAQLEDAPPPLPTASALPAQAPAKPAQEDQPKKKVKLPPGVVLGVTPPPDPERWLKKSERSTFGTGRRRKGGGGATQGSSVDGPAVGGGGGGKKGGKKRK